MSTATGTMAMKISSLNDIQPVAQYLFRIGAEPRGLRTAVVKQVHGAYWTDLAVIRLKKDGTVEAPEGFAPTQAEADAIKNACVGIVWPQMIRIGKNYTLPKQLEGVNPDKIFTYKNLDGEIIMLRHRIDDVAVDGPKQTSKKYIPFTLWDDGEWRTAEPEGKLPLYGLEHIKDNSAVFLHEGEKAARAVQRLINPNTEAEKRALAVHPWGQELNHAVHLGWQGGALNPERTDWSVLKKTSIKYLYLVADNDAPGREAIRKISKILAAIDELIIMVVIFTDEFPVSFDLADPFPENMFSHFSEELGGQVGEGRKYIGPSFRSITLPGTWATKKIMVSDGKKEKEVVILRREFARQWVFVRESNVYVCKARPERKYDTAIFNKMIRPFSDVSNTAELLDREPNQVDSLDYRPARNPPLIITKNMGSAINMFVPSQVRPERGDIGPWLRFMDYLIPNGEERHELMRWCATLVAMPEIRMHYGILMASKTQGIGKNTLGERILAPLVGTHNVGFPSETSIVDSDFNSWIANKRLVFVGEIYEGQSWKAYNKLKSLVTDKEIRINEKHQREYHTDNWAHFFICSNSEMALRIEESDRRWFYPTLCNVPWSMDQFREFYAWVLGGGLNAIAHWAQTFGDYVRPEAKAPMTERKRQLIEESKSEAVQLFEAWMDKFEEGAEVSVAIGQMMDFLRHKNPRMFEKDADIKRIAMLQGWGTTDRAHRVNASGSKQLLILSPQLTKKYKHMQQEGMSDEDIRTYINDSRRRRAPVMDDERVWMAAENGGDR